MEIKEVKGVASHLIKQGQDASIDMLGRVASNSSKESTDEIAKIARNWIYYCIGLVFVGAIALYLSSELVAIAVVLILFGLRAVITGTLLLQPGHFGMSVLLGWKARLGGTIFVGLGIFCALAI